MLLLDQQGTHLEDGDLAALYGGHLDVVLGVLGQRLLGELLQGLGVAAVAVLVQVRVDRTQPGFSKQYYKKSGLHTTGAAAVARRPIRLAFAYGHGHYAISMYKKKEVRTSR